MHLTRFSQGAKLLGRLHLGGISTARDSLPCSVEQHLQVPNPDTPHQTRAFRTSPFLGKVEGGSDTDHPSGPDVKDNKPAPKSGEAEGYGSSQVEQDRTGGKQQSGGPKPTEYGTMPRPGIPSREDSAGRDPDKTRPRTGTTGGDPNEMTPGKLPPGYDEDKPRPATATEQGATDEMQGKSQKMGHLGRDPRKDTGGPSPDYGSKDPQKSEEYLMQEGSRKGEQGSLNQVDTGEMAGMPKDAKPPSASPAEHHSDKRQAKGPAGSRDSWDPSSSTPSLDKGARVTDPRVAPEQRSRLSPTDGPSEGSPEPGKYAEELTENVRPNETPEGPQDVPPAVPSASKGAI